MGATRETVLPLLMLVVGVGVGLLLAHPATQTEPSAVFCQADKFECSSGECLDRILLCDGWPDCEDNSDEQNCTEIICDNQDHFRCNDRSSCIPKTCLCDGVSDCRDYSDEANCPTVCKESDSNPCANKTGKPICVQGSWICDSDCPIGSDGKKNCPNGLQCKPSEFSCPDKISCIHKNWICDGDFDCPDGADETLEICSSLECESDSKCAETQACVRKRCANPCIGHCGDNTICSVSNHTPHCSCKVNFTGDPLTKCTPFDFSLCLTIRTTLRSYENLTSFERRSKKKFCLGNKEVSWLQALAQCRSMDMDLASISDSQEQETVASLIMTQTGYLSESVWLSGNDEDVPGQFQWTSTGDHVSYSNWFQGEPVGAPAHCMEMRRNDFKWRNYQCTHQQGFVCEYYARNNQSTP